MILEMRVQRPAEGVYAFYEGRVEGRRFAEGPNWVDEGALSLGIASHALVRVLRRSRDQPELRATELRELIEEPLEAGWIRYFPPYEAVHRENIETVLAASAG